MILAKHLDSEPQPIAIKFGSFSEHRDQITKLIEKNIQASARLGYNSVRFSLLQYFGILNSENDTGSFLVELKAHLNRHGFVTIDYNNGMFFDFIIFWQNGLIPKQSKPKVLKLEETNHSFYCHEGNYYQNGHYQKYDSVEEWFSEWGGYDDINLNRIHRFDIYKTHREDSPHSDYYMELFYIQQRKAIVCSVEFPLRNEADLAIVEPVLLQHFKYNHRLWSPFNVSDLE